MEILNLFLSFCSLTGVIRLLWVEAQKNLLRVEVNGKEIKLPLASYEEEARRNAIAYVSQQTGQPRLVVESVCVAKRTLKITISNLTPEQLEKL